jgi:hypothetical protein
MDFYVDPPSALTVPLKQGDVLVNIPFIAVSISSIGMIEGGNPQAVCYDLTDRVPEYNRGSGVAGVEIGPGCLLNQTCDLTGEPGREKPVLVARVRPITDSISTFNTLQPYPRVKRIRELGNPGKNPTLFYLPPLHRDDFDLPASIVDVLDTTTFAPSNILSLVKLRRASMNGDALRALQERLAYAFGRYAAADDLYFTEEEAAAAERANANRVASHRDTD